MFRIKKWTKLQTFSFAIEFWSLKHKLLIKKQQVTVSEKTKTPFLRRKTSGQNLWSDLYFRFMGRIANNDVEENVFWQFSSEKVDKFVKSIHEFLEMYNLSSASEVYVGR